MPVKWTTPPSELISAPPPSVTRPCHAAQPRSSSSGSSIASRKPGATTLSGLSRSSSGLLARAAARLQPAAKPRFAPGLDHDAPRAPARGPARGCRRRTRCRRRSARRRRAARPASGGRPRASASRESWVTTTTESAGGLASVGRQGRAMIGAWPAVFVTRRLPGNAVDRLAEEHEVDVWDGDRCRRRGRSCSRRAAECEGLLALLTDRVDAELLDALPAAARRRELAVGTDNVDLEEAERRGDRGRQHAGGPDRDDRRPRLRADPRRARRVRRGGRRGPRGRVAHLGARGLARSRRARGDARDRRRGRDRLRGRAPRARASRCGSC